MGLHNILCSHSNFEFPFCSNLIFLFSILLQAQLMSKFKPKDGLGMSLEHDGIYNSPTWMNILINVHLTWTNVIHHLDKTNRCIKKIGWNLFKYFPNNFVDGHKCSRWMEILVKDGWIMINERCTNDWRIRGEWWIYTMNNLC
jgi:hypothetical protein